MVVDTELIKAGHILCTFQLNPN